MIDEAKDRFAQRLISDRGARSGAMNLIDANVFIRYLIGDDATKQQKSKELIERIRAGQEEAFTTDIIIHEVCYVLSASTHYNLSHQDIRDRLYPILAIQVCI